MATRFNLFLLSFLAMAAYAMSIRCYLYSNLVGVDKTPFNCSASDRACMRQDYQGPGGIRIIQGSCGSCGSNPSCTECYTDLCNSAHPSTGASAVVSLLSGALLVGLKSLLL